MRSEDNLWPLLLHHLPFGASPEKPTVLTRVQADAALFLPRPVAAMKKLRESLEVKEEQTADDLTRGSVRVGVFTGGCHLSSGCRRLSDQARR
jgi:hypothetical protein